MSRYHGGGYGYGDILLAIGVELQKGNNIDIEILCRDTIDRMSSCGMTFTEIFRDVLTMVDADSKNYSNKYMKGDEDYSSFNIRPSKILDKMHDGILTDTLLYDGNNTGNIVVSIPDTKTIEQHKRHNSYKSVDPRLIKRFAEDLRKHTGNEISFVDHTMKPYDIVNVMRKGSVFVGYDGGIGWLANWACLPSIIISTNTTKSAQRNHDLVNNLNINDKDVHDMQFQLESAYTANKTKSDFYGLNNWERTYD